MFRRRRSEDFQHSFSSSIFVSSLSPRPANFVKKTPKSKILLKTPVSLVRQRSKSNESKHKKPKDSESEDNVAEMVQKTPRGRKKKEEEDQIVTEDPIPELDQQKSVEPEPSTSINGSRPGRIRKKSAKLAESSNDNDHQSSKTEAPKSKTKVLKNSKISDFFKKVPVPQRNEVVPGPSEMIQVKKEPEEEETDPDLPYIAGVSWAVGAKCEAMDNDGSWYRSKIVTVSKEYKMVKIHFEGWKPKYDAWYMMESDLIRAASEWAELDSSKLKGTAWKKRIDGPQAPKRKSVEPKVEPEIITEVKLEPDIAKSEEHDMCQESQEAVPETAESVPEPELVFIDELKFEVGARLEAQDKTNHWYRGKIVAVSHEQQVVKVHYDGWKPRWDTWYTMDSERLRPLTRGWVDPRLLPKVKQKRKTKTIERTVSSESTEHAAEHQNTDVCSELPCSPVKSPDRVASPSAEMKSPEELPPKRKRKRKSLDMPEEKRERITTKIRLGVSPEIVSTDEKPKKKRKRKKAIEEENMIEHLPESSKSQDVILEEVAEETEDADDKEPAQVPDEISYANLIEESREERSGEKVVKRSKRKKKERTDASDWVSEEVLDRVTSGEIDDLAFEDEKPAKRKRLSTSVSETDALQEELPKKRGRRKKSSIPVVPENEPPIEEEVLAPADEPEPEPEPDEEPLETNEDEETEELTKKRKKKDKKTKVKKVRTRKSSTRESVSEPENDDSFEVEPPDESPPSEIDESDDYVPFGEKKSRSTGKKGRPKKFVNDCQPLEKGAEWKKVGDDEFMDIPPPTSAEFAVPLPKKKLKKEKKFKKPKVVPEYTDAYNKAMLAMSIAEEKEKRKLERRLQRLKQKEIEEKSSKKKRRAGPSAYQLFCNHNRPRLMAQNPGASFALINRKLGETWHNIGEREKSIWRRKSKKMKEKGTVIGKAGSYAKQVKELSSLLKPGQRSVQGLEAAQNTSLIGGDASPFKVTGTEPLDAAAHLKLLGESLSIIGQRLMDHQGEFAVQGTVSVMLDSFLCSLGPLMCLTTQVPELDSLPQKTLASTLDSIAYFMPGL